MKQQPNPFNTTENSMMQMQPIQINPLNQMQNNPLNADQQMHNNRLNSDQTGNAFNNCNEGIANGFGPMFFNIRDPSFNRQNTPIPQQSSKHPWAICGTVCFWTGLIITILFIAQDTTFVALVVITYLIYLCVSICNSEIRQYFNNIKRFEQYQKTYDTMVQGKGYFTFWIQCYHYVTTRNSKGKTSRRKVVTHTATEIFTPIDSVDESGELMSISDIKSYVFFHYLKRYYFIDDRSQNIFKSRFNGFVSKNRRDQYQNYTHTFQIQNYQEHVAYTALGQSQQNQILFYLFTFLGLALPYSCILERNIARYDCGILKRLTC